MLKKVILSGELGKKFGRIHRLAVRSPAEAIRAMSANFREFAPFVAASETRGVGYKVLVDSDPLGAAEDLHKPFAQTFRIVPVLTGGKDGFMGFLAGAALIGAAFLLPVTPLIAGFSMSMSSIAFGLGTSLLLGGVTQMLSPQPSAPKASDYERPESKPSAYFNGPVNTTAQGQCVPVGYGRAIIGSHVASFGITSDDYNAAGIG